MVCLQILSSLIPARCNESFTSSWSLTSELEISFVICIACVVFESKVSLSKNSDIFSFALLDNVKNRADVASIIIPEIYPTAEGLSEAIYIKVVINYICLFAKTNL